MTERVAVTRWHMQRETLRIVCAVIALLTGISFIMISTLNREAFFAGSMSSIYWLIVDNSLLLIVLGTISYIATWLAIALWYPEWPERILLAVIWLILGCGILTFLGPPIGETYTHTDSIRTRDGVYHTGYTAMWWGSCPALNTGDDCTDVYRYTPVVFRCDPFGLVCRAIYFGEDQVISGEREDLPAGTFTLDGSTISLLVDGDIVWEYSSVQGND
jgi:hypothetical protein